MRVYARVFYQCLRNSISYLLAYRANFFMHIIVALGWLAFAVGMVEVFFAHASELNGWNKTDVFVLIITLQIGMGLANALTENIVNLTEEVRMGAFDFTITKPIDSQFLTVFRKPDLLGIVYTLTYITPMLYILFKAGFKLQIEYLPLFLVLLLLANIIWGAIRIISTTLTFWWQRLDNITELLYTIAEFGRYPTSIYPRFLRNILYTIMPVALVAFVPAEALLGRIHWSHVAISLTVAVALVSISRIVWLKAIRSYSSASS